MWVKKNGYCSDKSKIKLQKETLFCFVFFIKVLLIKLPGSRYLMVGKVNMLILSTKGLNKCCTECVERSFILSQHSCHLICDMDQSMCHCGSDHT